jgi:hypothetical protein
MTNTATPDENGFSVGDESLAQGAESYGKIGNAYKIPLLGRNTDTSETGIRCGSAVEGVQTQEATAPDYGLARDFYMPWNGDDKNVLAGRIVCLWSSVGEDARFEFWLKKGGVMTKVATLDQDGVFVNTGGYKQSFSTYFTSDGSEIIGDYSVIDTEAMKGGEVIQVDREIQPLIPTVSTTPGVNQFYFNPSLGRVIVQKLNIGETLRIIYKKTV